MSNVPMTLPELVISTQGRPYSHTCSYMELSDGRIFHSSYGIYTISEDGGLTWSKQTFLKDRNGDDIHATSCVRLSGKCSIGLVGQMAMKENLAGHAVPPRYMAFYRSEDNGQTWEPPVRMFQPNQLFDAGALTNVALRTSSGRIIVPVSAGMGKRTTGPNDCHIPNLGKLVHNQFAGSAGHFYSPGFCGSFVCYSDDEGRSWKINSDGLLFILHDWSATFSYCVEPSVTEVEPGRLLMFMRTGLGRLFQAWSDDNGESWTRPMPTSLAACTTPCQIRKLPTGHLLCVWSQHSAEEIKRGQNRTRLSSAISRDGGRIWEFFQNIESIHETTHVPPGPIEPTRPVQIYPPAGQPAAEWPQEYIVDLQEHTRFSYPSVGVLKDRVIVSYNGSGEFEEDPVEAKLVSRGIGGKDPETGQYMGKRLKILPLKWFYGGKEPADNPYVKARYEPIAKP